MRPQGREREGLPEEGLRAMLGALRRGGPGEPTCHLSLAICLKDSSCEKQSAEKFTSVWMAVSVTRSKNCPDKEKSRFLSLGVKTPHCLLLSCSPLCFPK